MMSFEPPAAKLTTNLTGRLGYFSCASAGTIRTRMKQSKATQNRMMRMASLPFDLHVWPWRIAFALMFLDSSFVFFVARMKRSEIRGLPCGYGLLPGFASLHPGYKATHPHPSAS